MVETQTHPSALANLAGVLSRVYAHFDPPPDITVSEWAVRNRVLPKGTTSRPGPFKPEKFQIEMMDVILDPLVHEVVIQKSTQVGYSDAVINNICGYYIDADPKPIMLVQPTIDNAKDYGKKRITPMIESCTALRSKIKPPTSRRAGNTLALKEFPGGFLKLTGANSGAGLRSDPVPVVLFDEVDGYPIDVDGEGDPVAIGTRRTDGYADYKIVKGSTPAKPKGISPIERDFLRSDMRRFHVPCPFCSLKQVFWWRDPVSKAYRLFYSVDADGQVDQASVAYICAGCQKKIPERYKQQMLNAGEWVAEFPDRATVGFHINALYSPWRENWPALAQEWHEANKENNPEKLKAFINLRLGETWEEQGDSVEALTLKSRLEPYQAEIPDGVGLLTAAVDVQSDRLECVVKGWGDKEESWLIAYQQLFGDPGQETVWNELDSFLLSTWEHASGQKVKITCTMIDSGGLHTDSVYRFVRARQHRKIFALKGSSESGKEILGKFSINNQYRVKLWLIGTDTAKDRIFARMKIPGPGPGYMHLPDFAEDEYLAQLTSEKAVRRYRRGKGTIREYLKTRARNEALDLEVYALAALYVLGQAAIRKLGELAAALRLPPADPPRGGPGGSQGGIGGPSGGRGRPGGGSSWVQGW
ncbi:MAG: phage terminase large subunit family protein [Acidobacteriia bacterium]|nr:phage terminase large subunit family protein [Terriglobia bacterium]